MPIYGSLNDDAEMPEGGAPPPKPKKDPFERPPRENTHPWVVYEFNRAMVKAGCGRAYLVGILHRTIRNLYEEGYSYGEIVLMARTFFIKYGQDVRMKRSELDVAQMFAAKVPQLKAQVGATLRGMEPGRKTNAERNREMAEAARKSLMGDVE